MNQPDISKRFISEFRLVMAFHKDTDVRLKQREFAEAFKPLFPDQSSGTNIADLAPPNSTRILSVSPVGRLTVSQEQAQIEQKFFDAGGKSERDRFSELNEIVKKANRSFENVKNRTKRTFTGLVAHSGEADQ